ncbi:MAG: HPr family phosphocarrier protein [Spirochaetota bacterium]
MKELSVSVPLDGEGLHVRPASDFVKLASKFPCEIIVIKDGIEVNGKSIMGLMMLALAPGDQFLIRAEGEEEAEAVSSLQELVAKNFTSE